MFVWFSAQAAGFDLNHVAEQRHKLGKSSYVQSTGSHMKRTGSPSMGPTEIWLRSTSQLTTASVTGSLKIWNASRFCTLSITRSMSVSLGGISGPGGGADAASGSACPLIACVHTDDQA